MGRKSKFFFLTIVLFFSFCFVSCGSKKSDSVVDSVANKDISASTGGYTHLDDLRGSGIKIGVQTGTVFDTLMEGEFPSAKIEYYNTVADLVQRVVAGGIDSFPTDKPVADVLLKENSQITYVPEMIDPAGYAFAFTKNEKGKRLSEQMSELITKMKSDGTLENLSDAWFGDDENKKVINIENLPATNGAIELAIESGSIPFCYIRGEQIVGLDIAILEIFCREYGYALNIHDMNFDAVIPSVATRYDIGGSGISVTEERKEQVYFSEPYFDGGTVMIVKTGGTNGYTGSSNKKPLTSVMKANSSDYVIGTIMGAAQQENIEKEIPNATIKFYSSLPDGYLSVQQGKIDAFAYDLSSMRFALASGDLRDLKLLDEVIGDPINICIGVSKMAKIPNLLEKINEFIDDMKAEGILDNAYERWIIQGIDDMPEIEKTTEPALKLTVATTGLYTPYSYYKDGEIIGYDIEMAQRFAAWLGAELEIKTYDYGGIIAAAEKGFVDCIFADLFYTKERAETIDFSNPLYKSGTVLLVYDAKEAENIEKSDFLASLKSSFEKTFVRESRWKLIVQGITTTVFISIWAVILGTILGFAICMIRLTKNPIAYGLTTVYIRVLQGTPLVVLLMILFYIIFAKSSLTGEWVAVIAFALNFGAYVSEMMRTGIESVDKGQTEAALALGYTKTQSFFQIVMPQAAHHFLPVYKGEFISLVKSTSIVGYIAVQDLTKMSDVIRSRTYEAFFPLIVTAVIYFIISGLLSMLLQFIQVKIEPDKKNRKVKL